MSRLLDAVRARDRVRVELAERDVAPIRARVEALRGRLARADARLKAYRHQTLVVMQQWHKKPEPAESVVVAASRDRYRELRAQGEGPLASAVQRLHAECEQAERQLNEASARLRRAHGEQLARERYAARIAGDAERQRQSATQDELDEQSQHRSWHPRR